MASFQAIASRPTSPIGGHRLDLLGLKSVIGRLTTARSATVGAGRAIITAAGMAAALDHVGFRHQSA